MIKPSKELIEEAEEALKNIKIYVDKHDHIGSIEKAFHETSHINWNSMPAKIQKEHERLSEAAYEKIKDIKWMKSNGHY
jgi:hypothetical protein